MMTTGELRAQSECSILGLPPEMSAVEVFMRPLQKAIVGEADFKALIGKVKAGASTRTPGGLKLLIRGASGVEVGVIDRVLVASNGVAAKHAAQSLTKRENA